MPIKPSITEGSGQVTGLNEELPDAFSFSVTPNPVVNTALVQIDKANALNGKDVFIEVFDISGKQVAVERLIGTSTIIDLSPLTSGSYLMNLVAEGTILSTSQLIKE